MRFLLSVVLLVASLMAHSVPPRPQDTPPDPTAKLGEIIATQALDSTTLLNFHEHGQSVARLDVQTMTMHFSLITGGDLPTLTMSYVDTNGMRHVVETPFPSINPSARQLRETIKLHKQIVAAMQAEFPPMQPQPTHP